MQHSANTLPTGDGSDVRGDGHGTETVLRPNKRQKNAFSLMMAPQPPTKTKETYRQQHSRIHGTANLEIKFPLLNNHSSFPGRSGLEAYIIAPESFPPARVIYFNTDWVLINDMFPKASVHMLLLPRDLAKSRQHPFEALQDVDFLVSARKEVEAAIGIAAAELARVYGEYSAQEKQRLESMQMDEPPAEADLPPGRDWLADIKVGIHSHPSMSNMHIHILSRDMESVAMKHRKHYNSFNTPFFVELNEFGKPLKWITDNPSEVEAKGDATHEGKETPTKIEGALSEEEKTQRYNEYYLERDLCCWRCGKNYGNKFARLKEHLHEEWKSWKAI